MADKSNPQQQACDVILVLDPAFTSAEVKIFSKYTSLSFRFIRKFSFVLWFGSQGRRPLRGYWRKP